MKPGNQIRSLFQVSSVVIGWVDSFKAELSRPKRICQKPRPQKGGGGDEERERGLCLTLHCHVPASSPSRGGDVAVCVFDINQPSLPTPFYSVRVSISVFMARSTVFYSINSHDNSPLFHPVPPVLFLLYWSFQPDISS